MIHFRDRQRGNYDQFLSFSQHGHFQDAEYQCIRHRLGIHVDLPLHISIVTSNYNLVKTNLRFLPFPVPGMFYNRNLKQANGRASRKSARSTRFHTETTCVQNRSKHLSSERTGRAEKEGEEGRIDRAEESVCITIFFYSFFSLIYESRSSVLYVNEYMQ